MSSNPKKAEYGAAGARREMVQSEPRMNLRYSDTRLKDVRPVLAPHLIHMEQHGAHRPQ